MQPKPHIKAVTPHKDILLADSISTYEDGSVAPYF